MDDRFFNQTVGLFQEFNEVDAIVLGGSRASGKHDSGSDYDIYIYLNNGLCTDKRKNALSQTCKYMEINNTFWETEDDCVLNSGIDIDLTYRSIDGICQSLSCTLEKHFASNGYTTCICYNVFNSKVLYDPKGLYSNMVKRFTMPYPEPLRLNIVSRNRELLDGKLSSYSNQIKKAINRNDAASINHRIAEFIKSYFDILFALNRTFHPGEKRLIEFANELCEWLPADFETDIRSLIAANGNDNTMPVLRKLILSLDEVIDA